MSRFRTLECEWCSRPIPDGSRADARFCRTACRQAAWRARIGRAAIARTSAPMRLAYADPPYIGLARRYYGDHADYAGEVDHAELLSRLATFDGWALSCSAASVPAIAALVVAQGLTARLAVWTHRPRPHPTARILTGWEGVWIQPARAVVPGSALQLVDVLADVTPRPRPTLPTSIVGMKPPRFLEWLFGLLGAMPGDELEDLFPGSGMVPRAWMDYVGERSPAPGEPLELFAAAAVDGKEGS